MKRTDVTGIAVCDARDVEAMLKLNNEHAEETSTLTLDSLHALLGSAYFVRCVDGGATAFLIALRDNASYDNPNFMWFKARRRSFVYVDRIVVSQGARGRGIAKTLYNELMDAATQAGIESVVCEVNTDPPNPVSEAFHAAMGFSKVGQATIHGGTKTVGYLERILA